jgi:putative peptide zinc metalloprotease protein
MRQTRVQGLRDRTAREQARPETGPASTGAISVRPRLAPDAELVGELLGSGFADQQWLIRRDGRYIQLTELLYRVAEQANGERSIEEIAERVTAATDWAVEAEHVEWLIQAKLMPLGLVTATQDPTEARPPEGVSPLQVRLRAKTIGPRVIDPITAVLQTLYAPPILVPMLMAIAIAHVWLYRFHGVAGAVNTVLYSPALLPVLAALMVVSGIFHEFGHAAALRYGGGRVREMGVGLYLFYPVFYTDLTDGYRLGRWARVRGDLGGFYFHLIFALGLILLYAATGVEFLLAAVLAISLDILYQCLVFVRFDGYWALADLTGIPDFFSQMGAFVRSTLPIPGVKADKLPRLKPWVTAVFAAYIAITIPVLTLVFFPMFRATPTIIATGWRSLLFLAGDFSYARTHGDVGGVLAAVAQMILLTLPLLGLAYVTSSVGRMLIGAAWAWSKPTRRRRLVGALGGVAAMAVVAFLWVPQVHLAAEGAPEPAGVETFEVTGRTHVRTPVTYDQTPPVGGNHFAIWQNCGFYDTPVLNETAVHSMEHGAVWITYRPDLSPAHVDILRALARSQSHILASPYPDLPAAVVASAWGKQLRLDSADDARLDAFVRAFRLGRQAPEPGGPCDGGVGEPT